MAREKSPAQQFADLYKLTPAQAVGYLQRRGELAKTFDWRDLWQDEHARQFTVSRMARLDILAAMQEGVTASVNGELSRRDWMRDATKLLKREGWWGETTVLDPVTGEAVTTKFDSARLKLILDMNTRMAYSAGLWERIERNKASHPYVRYITKGDERVRASHRPWHNLVLPVDDPFWRSHWPPNGWRCRCSAASMTAREYERRKTAGTITTEAPPVKTREWLNKRTGEVMQVPVGIDPGFDYNVGRASLARTGELVLQKAVDVEPSLAARAAREVLQHPRVMEALALEFGEFARRWINEVHMAERAAAAGERYAIKTTGELRHVGALAPQVIEALQRAKALPSSALISVRDADVVHTFRTVKTNPLPEAWYADLPRHLLNPQAVLLDMSKPNLPAVLLVFPLEGDAAKLVVELDYQVKENGKKARANIMRSGRRLPASALKGYPVIDGAL